MAITRWDPLRDVLSFQNRLQSLLTDYSREGGRDTDTLTAGAFVPPVDIYEDADQIVLTLEVPGIPQNAFDISVENNTLSVRGERQWKSEQKTSTAWSGVTARFIEHSRCLRPSTPSMSRPATTPVCCASR